MHLSLKQWFSSYFSRLSCSPTTSFSATLKRGYNSIQREGWDGVRENCVQERVCPCIFQGSQTLALAGISKQNSLTVGTYHSPCTSSFTPNLPGRGRIQMAWSGSSYFDKIHALSLGSNDRSYRGQQKFLFIQYTSVPKVFLSPKYSF